MLPPSPVPPANESLRSNQLIRTADGTELVGDLYIPSGPPPFPAILQITPYGAGGLAGLGSVYAARGYLFLALDARGRYRSGGDWEPVSHDQQDGHAAIEWLAAHPLCNGRVGSRGHSYGGYNQLLAAIDAPAALQAMVVCVAPGDPFVNVPFVGGAYDISDLLWLLGMTGRVCGDAAPEEEFGIKRFGTYDTYQNPYQQEADEEAEADVDDSEAPAADGNDPAWWDAALRRRPFGDVDLALGVRHTVFREWLRHWQLDAFWRARSVGERLDRITAPALFISGWWDNNGRGATQFFRGLRDRPDAGAARRRLRLLMGPWNHDLKAPGCDDLPDQEARLIRQAADRDELNDEFAWFDEQLRDCPAGPATGATASLYLTGLHRWVDFADWPPPQTREQPYYLHPARRGSGRLREDPPPSGEGAPTCYRMDPDDPTPFARAELGGERSPFDNSALAVGRDDILVFDTAPVAAPTALVGECAALLYAAADAPDFDLCLKLLDLYPDGRAIYLTDGVLRARFRTGWDRPAPVTPGEVQPYRIDLWHLGHVLRPGHALRLEVASAAFRRIDVNPGTGGDLATDTDARPVRVCLHHSADQPSRLLLPLCHDPRLQTEG